MQVMKCFWQKIKPIHSTYNTNNKVNYFNGNINKNIIKYTYVLTTDYLLDIYILINYDIFLLNLYEMTYFIFFYSYSK